MIYYDNELNTSDIGCTVNEYLMDDRDKSKHWTSSIIVEGDLFLHTDMHIKS